MRKIYRSVDFGGLTTLYMLDTRLSGPDKQVEFTDLLNPATAAAMATLASPTRTLMGATQLGWLQGQMAASKATWQVRGAASAAGAHELSGERAGGLEPERYQCQCTGSRAKSPAHPGCQSQPGVT